jgi:hypothetical protein
VASGGEGAEREQLAGAALSNDPQNLVLAREARNNSDLLEGSASNVPGCTSIL